MRRLRIAIRYVLGFACPALAGRRGAPGTEGGRPGGSRPWRSLRRTRTRGEAGARRAWKLFRHAPYDRRPPPSSPRVHGPRERRTRPRPRPGRPRGWSSRPGSRAPSWAWTRAAGRVHLAPGVTVFSSSSGSVTMSAPMPSTGRGRATGTRRSLPRRPRRPRRRPPRRPPPMRPRPRPSRTRAGAAAQRDARRLGRGGAVPRRPARRPTPRRGLRALGRPLVEDRRPCRRPSPTGPRRTSSRSRTSPA